MILDAFKKHGLTNESELLPDWEENLTGFRKCLESHLKEDPVTAIILQEADLLMLAQQFLLERGLSIPNDVSLFCSDYSPAFDWSDPPISHSRWNQQKVIHRVIEWTRNISSGKRDTEKEIFDADFVEGGSIGPAPSSDWDSDTRGKVW